MESGKALTDIQSAADAVSAEEASESPLHEIESLCMRCEQNGITRILLTRIPHFRELVLMAFECPHCYESNNEVQFAGQLQPRGCYYQLKVPSGDQQMLNRQVVKSDSATIKIPELDFEIPPEAQRGTLSTVEGILKRAADELEGLQEERRKVDPGTAEAIDKFLINLRSFAEGSASFSFILDDPAGNSFIENPYAPMQDPSLSIKFYERTPEQQATLGFLAEMSEEIERKCESNSPTDEKRISGIGVQEFSHGSVGAIANRHAIAQVNSDQDAEALYRYSAPEEVETLPSTCGACGAPCVIHFYATKIPYFREVIVMASCCDLCGYRSSELKPGGEISKKGKRIIVRVQTLKDLSRDVIKSDTACVKVPELELELASGTLGGLVTTVEGLVTKTIENLERVHGFMFGDSLDETKKKKWQEFNHKLKKLLDLEEPWTLILDDALASSFVAPVTDAIEEDKQLHVEEYERTWEQNEELGLNDMDTSSADNAYNSTSTGAIFQEVAL
ncbi:zinc finger protein ZPR1 isoform X1 [Dendrobium catenatum]|uniref:zinc finger protein ZPR1 isoform X1 n=1 Tax=Dendrobium catenatum TaxID=906689 RepID=UPI0009F545C2|nr:zinc finger protein ZPR1 isoform X1 [Dendrobium catenatum]